MEKRSFWNSSADPTDGKFVHETGNGELERSGALKIVSAARERAHGTKSVSEGA
jgi:hypothetical protein